MRKLYVLDDDTSFLIKNLKFDNDDKVIQTQAEWDVFNLSEFKFDAVVILCELDWEGTYLQDFYGIELATELRRKYKLLCPIILTSTLKPPFFERQAEGNIYFNILFGRGTGFLELNELEDKLNSSIDELDEYPLSREALIDMNEMLLSQRFVIDKINHDLEPECDPDYIVQRMDELGRYLDKYQKSEIKWECRKNELKNTLAYEKYSEQEKEDNFKALKKELVTECERVISDINAPTKFDQEKRHKIIVLEDDKRYRQLIENKLGDKFQQVSTIDDATKAVEELKKDGDNEYVGIITDWRLYKNDKGQPTEYWQSLQGYEVLKKAAHDRFIALFSLTSESEKNVHKIRNELGLRIHLLKKQHLRGEGWDVLADTIQQKCDEEVELIASQPKGSSWKKWQPKYIGIRNSNKWKSFESDITIESNDALSYYIEAIENGNEKNIHGISEKGLTLNNLNNILITRRLSLGLYFLLANRNEPLQTIGVRYLTTGTNQDAELKQHSIDAYSIIRKDWWRDNVRMSHRNDEVEDDEWGKFNRRKKNLFYALALKLSELPEGLLPEEKKWLKQNEIDYKLNSTLF